MEQNFEKFKNLILSLEEDFTKFYIKKNNSAGTRIRKGLQELKTLAQQKRKEVTEIKNSRKEQK